MIILFQCFAKINLPYQQLLSIIKKALCIFTLLLLIIPANVFSDDPPPENTTECSCCGGTFEGTDDPCSSCEPCGSCSGCRNENCANVCICGDECDDICSYCSTCRKCTIDTCLSLAFNDSQPEVIIPNQEVIYEVTATGGETLYIYTWTGADIQTLPNKGKLTALTTGSKTITCSVKDRNGGTRYITSEDSLIVNVCNVDSISADKIVIMKGGSSESITITATLSEILPDDGEIEWQNSTDGGANWSANISGENETQITLDNTGAAEKYKYRARVKGHTVAEDGWEESADLYIIEFESIDGYIYGESDRKIESMEALTVRANIVASGYIKFKATVAPDDLYFKWSATDGTLTDLSGNSPEGAGNNYKEVKFDAPDGHEQNVTLTLEIKENANGSVLLTETVDLKTIRPYVMRMKFVDHVNYYNNEQQLPENGSESDPEFDAKADKNCAVCYQMNTCMQIQLDIAGNKTDDSGNNLTMPTEIQIIAKALYDGKENQFALKAIDNNTANWELPDYNDVQVQSLNRLPYEIAEYQDFKMQWTFRVKNSSGQWVCAYEEGSGYSHETVHRESDDASGKIYGLYLVWCNPKFGSQQGSHFKKFTLDYACKWADGKSTANGILQGILDGIKDDYVYDDGGNCWFLSKEFDHASKVVGLFSKLHKWSAPIARAVGSMVTMYPNWFEPIGPMTWPQFQTGNFANGWGYHVFVEADGCIYDPSAHVKRIGSWSDYETSCFEKYLECTQVSPSYSYQWVQNPSGYLSGCQGTATHDDDAAWPNSAPGFVGPSTGR